MLLNVKLTIGEGRFFLINVCFWMPTYWRPFKKSRNDSLVARTGRWILSDKWCSIGCTWIKLMSGLVPSSEFKVPSSKDNRCCLVEGGCRHSKCTNKTKRRSV